MSAAADEPRLRTRDALALGLLHGPAELLPISSSGHVAVVPWLCGWPYSRLDGELRKAFEVALHAGTAAALLVGLRDEVGAAARELDRRRIQLVVLSFLPPAIVGCVLERPIEQRLGTPATVAAGLVVGALAMAVADVAGGQSRRRAEAGACDALCLGLAQACALVPGVSRNGATLAAARARGFAREDSSVLSRHCALPIIGAAAAREAVRARRHELGPNTARGFAAGIATSFASTLAALHFVRQIDHGRSPMPLVIYRLALAGLIARRRYRDARAFR
jgi:undecaprenyl-diphosphatase